MAMSASGTTFRFRDLPLEVRNNTYEILIAREFIVMWSGYRLESYDGDYDDHAVEQGGRNHLALLSVSKDTRAEAMQILHSRALFSFQIEFGHDKFGPSTPLVQALFNLVQNIQLDVHMIFAENMRRPINNAGYLRKLCKAIFENLSGNAILRKKFILRFTHYTNTCSLLLRSPLFEAVEKLTGFEILIIEINSPRLVITSNEGTPFTLPWKTCVANLMENTRTTISNKYDSFLERIRERLQADLGTGEPIADAEYIENVNYARYIEFHPRRALTTAMIKRAADMMSEAIRMSAEVARL